MRRTPGFLLNANLPKWIALTVAAVTVVTTSIGAADAGNLNVLWYDEPATKWEEALPVGNGRLSAMIFGHPNMFDAHPPFQIDGNFGGAAGIVEMLMQSRLGEIELLPALPQAWPSGSVKGLRARGAFEVDVSWHDGRLVQSTIRSLRGGTIQLRCGSGTRDVTLSRGETYVWNGQ